MKRAAQLVSGLLIRKGDAIPTGGFAHVGADLSQLLPARGKLEAARAGRVTASSAPGAGAGRTRTPKRRTGVAQVPRVPLTLRLDPERHRRLKIFCTRSQRTTQAVLLEALDIYLKACGADGTRPRAKVKA